MVELRTEKGEVLGRAGEIDGAVPAYLPDFEDDQFPTIRFIDRYGDTVFNSLPMNAVLPAFGGQAAQARDDPGAGERDHRTGGGMRERGAPISRVRRGLSYRRGRHESRGTSGDLPHQVP